MNKKVFLGIGVVLLILFLFLFTSCLPGKNELTGTENSKGEVAGFWLGLWNGLIAPITFIISLFNKAIRIYEVHNNGAWYDLGFLLGVMIIFGGGAGGASSKRRR